MKPTKKQELEIMQVYDTWMHSYLNGDVKTYDSFLDVGYRFIGSTNNEEFLNKKETVNFFKATADQLSGKTEKRNSIKTIEQLDGLVLITDLFDAYFLNGDDWAYYGRFRFTSAMRKNKNGWRFMYQHFSTPDSKAQEGETLGTEQITKENQELRDAIKRRTVELEQKNTELQIEAALERVRTRAMAMHNSNELGEVAAILFEQISLLRDTPERFNIAIVNQQNETFDIWVTDQKVHQVSKAFVFDVAKSPVVSEVFKAWKGKKKSIVQDLHGKSLENWIRYFNGEVGLPFNKEQIKEHRYINSIFFSHGCIGITTNEPPKPEDLNLIERFAKVFQQTYTRFLDLQKAEAQARESEIELALERVRARSMAMQKSEELKEVIKIVYQQLTHLKINLNHSGFVVDYTPRGDWHFWIADEQDIPSKITHPYFESVWANQFNEAKEKGADFFATNLNFEEKNKFYNELLSFIPELPEEAKDFYLSASGLAASTVLLDTIGLYIENFEGIPYTDEENNILMRFGKVFQQTYTRFNDLQKAEAQAREAQIEAALERVRSRSMAMHKSDEMLTVIEVVSDQLIQLNLNFNTVSFGKNSQEGDFKFWLTSTGQPKPVLMQVPPLDSVVQNRVKEAKKKGLDFFADIFTAEENREWCQHLIDFSEFKFYPEKVKDFVLNTPGFARSSFLLKNIDLYVGNYQAVPFSKEENAIFQRFAQVFEQAYTRFLDLQKAETQAREAQIETALEKVRGRTMAMHKSEELAETALVLYEQFTTLGNIPDRISIGIFKEETKEVELWSTDQSGSQLNQRFIGSWEQSAVMKKLYKKWKSDNDSFVADLSGQNLKDWLKYIREEMKLFVDDSHMKGRRVQQAAFFSNGMLLLTTNEPIAEEIMHLLIRFARVFNQTYTRFLDLQKAEAQAREAQIENALEKVRSRSMAMHKSDEMLAVIEVVSEQLIQLNLNFDFVLFAKNKQEGDFTFWITSLGQPKPILMEIPTMDSPVLKGVYEAQKKGITFLADVFTAEENREWHEHLIKYSDLKYFPENIKEFFLNAPGFARSSFLLKNVDLYVGNYRAIPFANEENSIFRRFAQVFEQAYTRFLDLQKAEAQAKEAQIEAALERVRSRSMAMYKSDELREAGEILCNEIIKLGIETITSGYVIMDDEENIGWNYAPNPATEKIMPMAIGVPHNDTEIMRSVKAAWKKQEPVFVVEMNEAETIAHQTFIAEQSINFPINAKQLIAASPPKLKLHNFNFKQGYLIIVGGTRLTGEQEDMMLRFTKVFQQTYRRFLDLQRAEAQAREATIEAALERVRSRSMAMHKSNEMQLVADTIYEQLKVLDFEMHAVGMSGAMDPKKGYEVWAGGVGFEKPLKIPYTEKTRVQRDYNEVLIKRTELFSKTYKGKTKKEYINFLLSCNNFPPFLEKLMVESKAFSTTLVTIKNSGIQILRYTAEPYTIDENGILIRFAKVFEQAYIRFMDLEKAEAQTREAQIEGALERVRSKTMAMHNSKDLENIVISLFDEVLNLGIDKSIRCGIGILEDHEGMETRSVNSNSDGTVELRVGMLNMTIHPMLVGLKKAWKKGSKGYSYDYIGKDVRKYYEALNNEPEYPFNANLETLPEREFHQSFFYSSGILFAFSERPIAEESSKILARFAAVFGQTYRRFLDLQKAEVQAKEATKQASLDRVRGQIASMRTAADLERITPLVWNELTTMDVPFIRCGVFIIDEPTEIVEVYLSAPDGHSLGVLHLQFNADPLTESTVAHWRKGSIFKKHWNQKEFISWTQNLMEQGQISNKITYQGAADPPESLDLHFIPFKQGMLYVGNTSPLDNEQIDLVQSLADAFAIAYARYEDFTKLEKAKESVEITLSELKAAQNQLVQSEKMASLGELTAGIAHEIQNPLNFVNNFSEVSGELLEEMKTELVNKNIEDAIEIANDVIQNLEKILHHGKRADGIVKGMLQHSRSSSGQKELTDINALTDEYLRLAYHGLRAKDKSFNATMDTNFDKNIGSINVVPQELGRVILNLLTNAFYIVNEKKQMNINGYEPTVSVLTKKKANKLILSISDNGNGIPKKVLDKIFQPFFTTKPTGQGTGLGLSLSYDIVKAHNGELTVETKEGEGTTFTIALPIA